MIWRNTKLRAMSKKRMDICNNCPSFIKDSKRCKECGCFLVIKTRMENQKCPKDKW